MGAQGYNANLAGSQGFNAAYAAAQGYPAATMGATGYNAANAASQGYGATNAASQGYGAGQAAQTQLNVDPNQTVQAQITGLLMANSPLLRQAQAQARQQAASRGLMNSSMAVQAGQQAVLNAALPIAQADAATYANAARYNADAANQMAQFNVGAQNQASQFGASLRS